MPHSKTNLYSPVKQKLLYLPVLQPIWSSLQQWKLCPKKTLAGKCLGSDVTHSITMGLQLLAASPKHSHTVKPPLTSQRGIIKIHQCCNFGVWKNVKVIGEEKIRSNLSTNKNRGRFRSYKL